MIFMARRSKLICAISSIVCIFFIFYGCDSYHSRKKLIKELSSLYVESWTEFNKIQEYFLGDSLPKSLIFRYEDKKIDIGVGDSLRIIESIDQIKGNPTVYQILAFMKNKRISIISGNGKEGWITLAFEDYNHYSPCFNFWYRSDFNPEDEDVKREVENIKDTKTKNWTYILDKKGWYIRGVKCF